MLVHPEVESETSDDRIVRVLYELGLEQVINQAGGLDGEQNWEKVLSLGEQQLLALANVLLAAPRFVLLDRVDLTLGPEQLKKYCGFCPSVRSLASTSEKLETSAIFIKRFLNTVRMVGGPGPLTLRSIVITDRL